MNFVGMIACLYVAFDAYQKGAGAIPQELLTQNALWFWNVVAIGWTIGALGFFLQMLDVHKQ